jgi:TP901 family phage tail tape measure protein
MTTAGVGLLAVFGLAVKKAADFERKMDFFQAVTGTSAKQMKTLDDVTLQLAQDSIFTADQLADGMVELGKAGVSAKEIIAGIGKAMVNLGAAGDIPLAQAGQIITSTLRQFDLGANKAVKVTDLLAGAANASIADIEDIGVSLKYVGGVANVAGVSLDDTTTAISLLAKAGIRGSTAGTSLRQMLVSLPGVTGPAKDALKDLGIITKDGTNKFYDLHGNLKPLPRVFQILHNSMEGMSKEQKLVALRAIFNNRALAAAAILTRDGAKGFREMYKEMGKTTAAETAKKRLDNLSGDMEILRGNIETLLTKAGGPFQETLRGWVQSITKLVQSFANLPEGTQKTILQIIAFTGVALTAMGVITIVLGTIFRFIATMLKLGAGIRLTVNIIRGFLYVLGLIAGGAITATVAAIAAVVLILAAAFIIAYKKSETFRNFINGLAKSFMDSFVKPLVAGVEAVLKWFKLLATNPKAAWDQLKAGAGNVVSYLGAQFAKLPGLIGKGLSALGGLVGNVIDSIVRFFQSLPGRILSGLGALMNAIVGFFLALPGRLRTALGFLIVAIPALFLRMTLMILQLVGRGLGLLVSLFATLAPRVGFLIGFMIGRTLQLLGRFAVFVGRAGWQAVTGLLKWVRELPTRVGIYMGKMVARAAVAAGRFARDLPRLAGRAVVNMASAVSALPGKIGAFVEKMSTKARNIVTKLPGMFLRAGKQMFNGMRSGLLGLPGMIGGILSNVISAIKDKIGQAFDAVKGFASGMWHGFKKGLFGSPRTKIEYAMEDMTATIDRETTRLRRQVVGVQKLSLKMAKTQFGVGDVTGSSSGAASLIAAKKLAAAQVATTAAAPSRPVVHATFANKGRQVIAGTMRLTPDSRVMIEGIAQDVVDNNADYDDVLDGM